MGLRTALLLWLLRLSIRDIDGRCGGIHRCDFARRSTCSRSLSGPTQGGGLRLSVFAVSPRRDRSRPTWPVPGVDGANESNHGPNRRAWAAVARLTAARGQVTSSELELEVARSRVLV